MAANVLITKYAEKNSIIFYRVIAISDEKQECFAAIDPDKQVIIFYKTEEFNNVLGIIDIADPNKPYDIITGIHPQISKRVALELSKALKNKLFPNDLSFISH